MPPLCTRVVRCTWALLCPGQQQHMGQCPRPGSWWQWLVWSHGNYYFCPSLSLPHLCSVVCGKDAHSTFAFLFTAYCSFCSSFFQVFCYLGISSQEHIVEKEPQESSAPCSSCFSKIHRPIFCRWPGISLSTMLHPSNLRLTNYHQCKQFNLLAWKDIGRR